MPSGTQLTDSREYAEYFGRPDCRRIGASGFYVHEVHAGFHQAAYTGREPLGDANIYRLKVDLPVRDSQQLPA